VTNVELNLQPVRTYYLRTVWKEFDVTAAVARLNFRVPQRTEQVLRAAAELTGETLTQFTIGAAEERAEQLLAGKTLVGPDFFDRLVSALDEPVEPNQALRAAAAQEPAFVRR
jgi:uncharacterized protein (DUF1778 family)